MTKKDEQSDSRLSRVTVPKLDEIMGKPFKVLDDGFIRLVDYMGSDQSIVQAARVSYGKGTKKVHQDRGLIRYLMRHNHTTPFEMCEIKFHVRVPMDCWRQWIRHRTANVNEYSTRYSIAIDSAQKTNKTEWRLQSKRNKQGSDEFINPEKGKGLSKREKDLHAFVRDVYEERLDLGIAREQARKDLPLSTYTEAYWKIDLHNLFHFLNLRMRKEAQREIRSYAKIIGKKIVKIWCPFAWEAFNDYKLKAIKLSDLEIDLIRQIASGDLDLVLETAFKLGWIAESEKRVKRNREREEFETKLEKIGFQIPWADFE